MDREPFKFMVFSDIQIKNSIKEESFNVLDQIIEKVKEHKPEFVFFLGDAFENKKYIDVSIFNTLYEKFNEISKHCDTFTILVGNHDRAISDSSHSLKTMFPFAEIVDRRECWEYDDVGFCFYSHFSNEDEFIQEVKNNFGGERKDWGNTTQILLFHQEVNGCIKNIGSKITTKFLGEYFDYCIGGHIHNRMELDDKVLFVGSPLQRDFGDVLEERGIYLFEGFHDYYKDIPFKERFKTTFIPLNFTKYVKLNSIEDVRNNQKNIKGSHIWMNFEDEPLRDKIKEYAKSVRYTPFVSEDIFVDEQNNKLFSLEHSLKEYLDSIGETEELFTEIKDKYSFSFMTHKEFKIKKVHLKNFLSYEDLELDFSKMNFNLPIGIHGKNGVGKSTIFEAIVWGIYGETIRDASSDGVVNKIHNKNCMVQIDFIVDKKEYSIKRYRKDKEFKNNIIVSGIEQGTTNKITQESIDNLLCPYFYFKTLLVMSRKTKPLMEIDPIDRKRILDSIVGLNWIENEHKNISSLLKTKREESSLIEKNILVCKEFIKGQNDSLKHLNEVKDIEIKKNEEKIKLLKSEIEQKENLLSSTRKEAEKTQIEYDKKSELVEMYEKKIKESNDVFSEINKRLKTLEDKKRGNDYEILNLVKLIDFKEKEKKSIEEKYTKMFKDKKCLSCKREITKADFESMMAQAKSEIGEIKEEINQKQDQISHIKEQSKNIDGVILLGKDEKEQWEKQHENKLEELKESKKEKGILRDTLVQKKTECKFIIENIKKIKEDMLSLNKDVGKDIQSKMDAISVKIINEKGILYNQQNKLKEYKEQENKLERILKVFSPVNGFRNYLYKSIITVLQKKINCYLGKWNIKCEIEIKGKNEQIIFGFVRNNENIEYALFSDGERNRIDYSIMLSLYEISSYMILKTNIILIDELLSGLDDFGAEEIMELSKEFINENRIGLFSITHNQAMKDMFEKYILIEKDKFSKIERIIV